MYQVKELSTMKQETDCTSLEIPADPLLYSPPLIDPQVDEWDELALVSWYRQGAKRDLVRGMLAKAALKTIRVYPRFGTTCWFEVELRNPFSRAERFAVDIPKGEGELRVVTSAEEWQHLRRHVPVAFGGGRCGLLVSTAVLDTK